MTINKYKQFLNKYGLISLLFVLQHYEEQENYTECYAIQKLLIDQDLPTKLDNSVIKEVITHFQLFGLEIEKQTLLDRCKNYCQDFLSSIGGA